jgi:putative spermidine/putrescine transport system permease protein
MSASGTEIKPFAGATPERLTPHGAPGANATEGTSLAQQLRRADRRKKFRALALTMPLLAFLLVFFLVPLASLLVRAVENPEVADALPRTGQALADWDRESPPPAAAFAAVIADLSAL